MERVCEFLQMAHVFYVATEEGDQPRVRPFGIAHILDGKLCVMTGKCKPVSWQIAANAKVEVCACVGTDWVRIAGYRVEVIHFPGHTVGSSVYYLPEVNLMFSGDCFGLTGVADEYMATDHSGNADRANSIARWKTLTFPDETVIYNGHRTKAFSYADLMKQNWDFAE